MEINTQLSCAILKNDVRMKSLGFAFKKTEVYHNFKKIELKERGVIDDSQLSFF